MRSAEDDWEELPPSDLALASIWPLMEYEQHNIHDDRCSLFVGHDDCSCEPIRVVGPTGLA